MPLTITLSRVWAAIVAGAFLAMLVGLGIQTARIEGFKIWPISVKGYRTENTELKAQIAKLVDQSKQKQSEVREVIRQGKDRVVVVEREAKRVESAPLEGGCRTPKLVLQADI